MDKKHMHLELNTGSLAVPEVSIDLDDDSEPEKETAETAKKNAGKCIPHIHFDNLAIPEIDFDDSSDE